MLKIPGFVFLFYHSWQMMGEEAAVHNWLFQSDFFHFFIFSGSNTLVQTDNFKMEKSRCLKTQIGLKRCLGLPF